MEGLHVPVCHVLVPRVILALLFGSLLFWRPSALRFLLASCLLIFPAPPPAPTCTTNKQCFDKQGPSGQAAKWRREGLKKKSRSICIAGQKSHDLNLSCAHLPVHVWPVAVRATIYHWYMYFAPSSPSSFSYCAQLHRAKLLRLHPSSLTKRWACPEVVRRKT